MSWTFNAPGNVPDFGGSDQWHRTMTAVTKFAVIGLTASVLDKDPEDVTEEDTDSIRDRLAYADPTLTPPPPDATTIAIPGWNGFPRGVVTRAPWPGLPATSDDPDGRWRAAEHHGIEDIGPLQTASGAQPSLPVAVRDRQDEYLEWAARRDAEGRMTSIAFVAEGYDYYETLFEADPKAVVDLYQQFTGDSSITPEDLTATEDVVDDRGRQVLVKGAFNPRNAANLDPGIVHLSHRANALTAEVNLAAVSALTRHGVQDTTPIPTDDAQRLLCCSEGGEPNRNSDPLIGQQAYHLALDGLRYTPADPVGLYIAGVDEQRVQLPDGSPVPREWWSAPRGEGLWTPASRVLRLELAVPDGEHLTLEDLLVDGFEVRHPGQLASLVTVHLFVTTWPDPIDDPLPPAACVATCCRQQGTGVLQISGGRCRNGWDLAFPGLVDDQPGSPGLLADAPRAQPPIRRRR